jgi:hypothetical protein
MAADYIMFRDWLAPVKMADGNLMKFEFKGKRT